MIKIRGYLFRTRSRRILLQIIAGVSLVIAIGWLVVTPGFEPLLVLLASVATLITSMFSDEPLEADRVDVISSSMLDDCEGTNLEEIDAIQPADPAQDASGSGSVKGFLDYYQQAVFGGRQQELERLNKWLDQPEKRLGLMVAPAGMGKSALLVAWRDQLQQTGKAHVIYYPISLRFGTNSRHDTIKNLLEQMYNLAGSRAGMLTTAGRWPKTALSLLNDAFSLSELRALCFNLAVDFENLAGERKEDKARELLQLVQREGRLDELVEIGRQERPRHDWQEVFSQAELLYQSPSGYNDLAVLTEQLADQLRQTPGWDKPVVVIVDGLDELADQLNQPNIKQVGFLPGKTGEGVYVLVATRGYSDEERQQWEIALNWENTHSIQHFYLRRLPRSDIKEMVWRSGIQTEPDALTPFIDKIYRLSEEGDPLTAGLLVKWVKEWLNGHTLTLERLQNSGEFNPEPGLNGYIEWVWHQLEPIASGKAKPLFELLSLARGPLTSNDLRTLGLKVDVTVLNELVARSGRLIVRTLAGYVFSHPRIALLSAK